jgi:hypothetical protein
MPRSTASCAQPHPPGAPTQASRSAVTTCGTTTNADVTSSEMPPCLTDTRSLASGGSDALASWNNNRHSAKVSSERFLKMSRHGCRRCVLMRIRLARTPIVAFAATDQCERNSRRQAESGCGKKRCADQAEMSEHAHPRRGQGVAERQVAVIVSGSGVQ